MFFIEINAKFVHSNLALRYYKNILDRKGIAVIHRSYTINHSFSELSYDVLGQITTRQPILIFSIYIWNISYYQRLAELLKSLYPAAKIIVGGPEVDCYSAERLAQSPFDYLIKGEAEVFFEAVERDLTSADQLSTYFKTAIFDAGVWQQLDRLSLAYSDEELNNAHIIYYESSRGCPYNCSYCMSSTSRGVRFKSLARVEQDLRRLFSRRVPIIKFIDRTFNAPLWRARQILRIIEQIDNGITTCHFELSPNLIDEDFIKTLSGLRRELVQVEIGLQSATKSALHAIDRRFQPRDWQMIEALCQLDNVHVHVDLIGGLPCETLDQFRESIAAALRLGADHVQVGLLKLLPGTTLREQAADYHYIYDVAPPYEFYSNHLISASQKRLMMAWQQAIERVYNVGYFKRTLAYISLFYDDILDFYSAIGDRILSQQATGYRVGAAGLIAIIDELMAHFENYTYKYLTNITAVDFLEAELKLVGDMRRHIRRLSSHRLQQLGQQTIVQSLALPASAQRRLHKMATALELNISLDNFQPLSEPATLIKIKGLADIYHFKESGQLDAIN